jgi:hypothetical protein
MSFSVAETIRELDAEIARLTKLRAALVEASGESGTQPQSRVSTTGMAVIKAAARLRHARLKLKGDSKNADLKAAVTQAEKEVADAKAAMAKMKAERAGK